jgi:hypothetical protein
MVFVAPYSGAAKSAAATSRLGVRPLEVGDAFRIVPSAIQLEPLTQRDAPFLLSFADCDALHPDALLDSVPGLAEIWEPLRDLESDPSAADRLSMMLGGTETVANLVHDASEATRLSSDGTTNKSSSGLASPEPAGDLLERLLGKPPEKSPQAAARQGGNGNATAAQELVQRFAQRVLGEQPTRSHGSAPPPGDVRIKAEVELSRRLRALLTQEAFQRTSGTWFATEMVVRSRRRQQNLQIYSSPALPSWSWTIALVQRMMSSVD